MMKCIFGLLFLVSSVSFAKNSGADVITAIGKNWAKSEKYSISETDVTVTTQASQRFIKLRGYAIPVVTMTTGEIKSSTGRGVPKDLAAEMAKLTGITEWKKDDRGSYIAYEAQLPKEARLIKLFVSKSKTGFKYSVASIRLAYMLPTYYETELLQREFIAGSKSVASLESAPAWSHIFQFFVSPAYAADSSSIASWLNGIDSSFSNVNVNIDSNDLTNIGNSISDFSGTIRNGVNKATGSVDNLAGSIKGASQSVDRLTAEGSRIQDTIASTTNTIKDSVTDVNKTLKGFQDPKTFFKIGLASGFGYTIGSMLVQFATDGAASLVKKIFYEVTGQLDPATRDRMTVRGKKAWDDLEKLSEKVAEIDKQVAIRLAIMSELQGRDPMSLANELEDRRILLESEIRKQKDLLDKSNNMSARMQCSSAIREMVQQVELLKQMKPILEQEQPRSQAEMCASFDRIYQEWAGVELQMHNARSVLLNDMVTLATGAEKSSQEAQKSLASDRKKRNECKDSKLDSVMDLISDNNCKCESSSITNKCNYLCMEKQNYEDHQKSCLNMVAMNSKVDTDVDNLVQSELIRQNTQMLENSYRKLTKSYCVPGDTSGVCDGKEGGFNMIHNRMQNQLQQIKQACGNDSIAAPSLTRDIIAGQKKADMALASAKPLASASGASLPAKSEGGGFFSRILNFFKNLF
ncbi:hypothetical protein D3C87_88800 [compost metagenome]